MDCKMNSMENTGEGNKEEGQQGYFAPGPQLVAEIRHSDHHLHLAPSSPISWFQLSLHAILLHIYAADKFIHTLSMWLLCSPF